MLMQIRDGRDGYLSLHNFLYRREKLRIAFATPPSLDANPSFLLYYDAQSDLRSPSPTGAVQVGEGLAGMKWMEDDRIRLLVGTSTAGKFQRSEA